MPFVPLEKCAAETEEGRPEVGLLDVSRRRVSSGQVKGFQLPITHIPLSNVRIPCPMQLAKKDCELGGKRADCGTYSWKI